MTEPSCPDCKHLISKHDEFFCLNPKCTCNFGRATALARYERDIARRQLDCAIETLTEIAVDDGLDKAIVTLEHIKSIGEGNA